MTKWLITISLAIGMLAGGACRAGEGDNLSLSLDKLKAATLYSIKADRAGESPELQPAVFLELFNIRKIATLNAGVVGAEWTASTTSNFKGVLHGGVNLMGLLNYLDEGITANPILERLEVGPYISKSFSQPEDVTKGEFDYGIGVSARVIRW